jgi:hypothetical protein
MATASAIPDLDRLLFNGLDADGFDSVLNPVITEPVVQFTLYLKVKYEVEQTKAK